ncbi:hypothetical protein CCUS01_02829 [Colletotrichum cuscutae]|uniref:Uncharacterized protein n=1 Tax=Colletotrichum cuscutae TaxID=1209917 RepID=A0AAI9YC92_9PEZI|nr:hypothetical protein CCUS01_02829 [Colletotrichum cuscutae]
MDYDVLNAESTDPSEITFGLDRDDDTALGVSFYLIDAHDWYPSIYKVHDGLNIPNFVFINPKKDHPSAELKPLLERMCKVYVGDYNFFTPTNSAKIEILKHLPSIHLINIDIGMKKYRERGIPADLKPQVDISLRMEAIQRKRDRSSGLGSHLRFGFMPLQMTFTWICSEATPITSICYRTEVVYRPWEKFKSMPNGRVFSSFGVLSRFAFLTDSMNLPYCFFRARVPACDVTVLPLHAQTAKDF